MPRDKLCLILLSIFIVFISGCDGDGNGPQDTDAAEDVVIEDVTQDDGADIPGEDVTDVGEDIPSGDVEDIADVPQEEVAENAASEFCLDVAGEICEYIRTCCSTQEREQLLGMVDCSTPESIAESAMFLDCYGDIGPYVEDGTLEINDTAVPGCLGIFADMATSCPNFNATPLDKPWYMDLGCSEVFRGLLSPSEECEDSVQCTGSYYCDLETSPSVCTAKVGLGGACTENGQCVTGHVCVQNECTTPATQGELCDDDGDCNVGLYCDMDAGGLCRAMRTEGLECDPADDNCEGMCQDGDPPTCISFCGGV